MPENAESDKEAPVLRVKSVKVGAKNKTHKSAPGRKKGRWQTDCDSWISKAHDLELS